MVYITALKGLKEGDGLDQTDVINKVCEVYKAVVDCDECDMEDSLDELEKEEKDEIIAKVGMYFHVDIVAEHVHTVADLVSYVMSHDGETFGDILNKNYWENHDLISSCESLKLIGEFAANGHSTEGFLGKIADVFLSIANTFKTNVFKFTKALKRSEMHLFADGNYNLCKEVEATPFTTYMNTDVDIPTGMITTFENSTEYIKAVYEQLDAFNYGSSVLDSLKELRYKMYNNQINYSAFALTRQVMEKEKVIKWASTTQTKCYKDRGAALKVKFKNAYASMEEFSGIKDKLLSMEDKLQSVNKFVDVMDETSGVIEDMTVHIEQNKVPPTFIQSLSSGVRIVGESFDLYGQNAMRQMALEHNHIINYQNLYKLK